jgi:hypothetical protein
MVFIIADYISLEVVDHLSRPLKLSVFLTLLIAAHLDFHILAL